MSLITSSRCINHSNVLMIVRTFRTFAPLFKKGPEKIHHPPPPGYDPTVIKKMIKPESISSVEGWMRVRYKNRNGMERKIHAMAVNDRLVTESKEAEEISDSKLRALEQSLAARGFCRESNPYDPPEDVEERIKTCLQELGTQAEESWMDFPLDNHHFKFQFLTLCASKFNHEVPNSDLHQMKIARDVVHFYLTPIRGISNYDKLIREKENLPPNLCVIPDIKRFNPDDEGIHGIDPLPGHPDVVRGLRGQKKYPALKSQIEWPDI